MEEDSFYKRLYFGTKLSIENLKNRELRTETSIY